MNYDTNFLNLLDRLKIKTQLIEIKILTFDEREIRDIKGSITSGSMSVNGSAAIRRTINLSMFADKDSNNLTNIDNIISLNKKIKVRIGYKNTLINYQDVTKDSEGIAWFECGTYVISNATINSTTTGCTINIQGKDKMAMLDGSVGGTLPASVSFTDIYEEQEDGSIIVTHPTIYQIIQEAVNHYGQEPINNIIISDIDNTVKLLVKYVGDTPIWFIDKSNHQSFIISDVPEEGYMQKYESGDDIGYKQTDFTYPGELVLAAGDTVASLLDKIAKTLGNFEYFYDTEGNFHFQEIRNYLNTSHSSLLELEGSYEKIFSEDKYRYTFNDGESIISFNNNPKFDNFKNDFIVWGQRTTQSGITTAIRFRMAIDQKPVITQNESMAGMYMWEIAAADGQIVRYEYTSTEEPPTAGEQYTVTLIGAPCDEWREELYREALENALSSATEGAYDDELLAEWRKLYDTLNPDWENGWNPDVYDNHGALDYWLEFIDSEQLSPYSVQQIGRRTKVVNDTNIKSIYNMDVPDVIFIENNVTDIEELYAQFEVFTANGQDYCLVQPNEMQFFTASSTGTSCYDKIRELLYQNLTYNSTITISCLPRYYLEPNQLIYVNDDNSGINGDFVITQYTVPLQYSGTMSITAVEALTRV